MTRTILRKILAFIILLNVAFLGFLIFAIECGCVLRPAVREGKDIPLLDTKFKNAWVEYVEPDLVQVETVGSKVAFVFDIEGVAFNFRPGSLVPVSFYCVRGRNGECDMSSPYQFNVGGGLYRRMAKLNYWKWYGHFDNVWIAHGPGNGEYERGRLAVELRRGEEQVAFMELKARTGLPAVLNNLKRGDVLGAAGFIIENRPYSVFIHGFEFTIVTLIL